MFAVSKYKLVKQRHFTSKAVVKVTLDATVKQKASVAKKDKGKSREVTLQ